MTFRDWAVWDLDVWTFGWGIMLVFFFGWEYLSGHFGGQEMLTDHLRPIFHAAPITWYLAFGTWVWVGPHFLFPGFERWLFRMVGG